LPQFVHTITLEDGTKEFRLSKKPMFENNPNAQVYILNKSNVNKLKPYIKPVINANANANTHANTHANTNANTMSPEAIGGKKAKKKSTGAKKKSTGAKKKSTTAKKKTTTATKKKSTRAKKKPAKKKTMFDFF